MDNSYVQQYAQLERGHWWFIVRQKILLQFLRKNLPASRSSLTILNIGAAGGASSEWLAALGNVVSVEHDPAFLEQLRSNGITVTAASVTDLPFAPGSFDLVCAFDVIEHVADELRAIEEMKRVCKNGGYICLAVPAMPGLWSQHDVVNGHFRRYTRGSLIASVAPVGGLTLIDTRYFNSLLFVPIWMARKVSGFFRKKHTVSDFSYFKTPSWANKFLGTIFGLEYGVFRNSRFSRGVSLAALFKKM